MRIIRDYTCDRCGATREAFALSETPIELDVRPHYECTVGDRFGMGTGRWHAQLSATPTTFTFADRSGRKVARG
jgi:hypothetical protein